MSAEEQELLRHAVLECLAARHPAALPVGGIRRRVEVMVDFPVRDSDLPGPLALLKDKGMVNSQFDDFGKSTWWSATAAGVLRVERGAGAGDARPD